MGYRIVYAGGFIEKVAKLSAREQKQVQKTVRLMMDEPLRYPSLRTKKIQGQEGLFECSVNMDIRIVWSLEKDRIILLLDIGHHDILKKF